MMKKIYKYHGLIKFMLAIFVAFVLGLQNNIVHYTALFLLFAGLLCHFFVHTEHDVKKKIKNFSVVSGVFFSLIFSLGHFVYQKTFVTQDFVIFSIANIVPLVLMLLAYFVLAYFVFIRTFTALEKIKISTVNNAPVWKVWLSSAFIIFICYIPYFLRCYPALMSPDSFVQINNVEKVVFTNNHPFVQTWFFGGIYNLGKILFGAGNGAVAFYIIIQMIILACLFAMVVSYLYKKKVNKMICLVVLLFYALSPLHAFFSVTLWKDIIFGSIFILVIISLLTLIEKGMNLKTISFYTVSVLIMLFFRNNGIYIFILLIPLIILVLKNCRLKIFAVQFVILVFYFIITGPVYTHIGVKRTNTVEALSIPLQQIARVIVLDKEIDGVSREYLDELLDIEKIRTGYVPHIADPVKNSVDFDVLDSNKSKFIKVWFKILLQHPKEYIESYLSSTIGYWYPDVVYHAISSTNAANEEYNAYEYDIDNKNLLYEPFVKVIDKTMDKTLPFSIVFWSSGLYCCILFLSIIIFIFKKGIKSRFVIAYAPLVALWLSLMISAPVCAELRYIYGIFTCIPLCLIIPFINLKEDESYA